LLERRCASDDDIFFSSICFQISSSLMRISAVSLSTLAAIVIHNSPVHFLEHVLQALDLTFCFFDFLTLMPSRFTNSSRLYAQCRATCDAALVAIKLQQRATFRAMPTGLHSWLSGF
jgi:hypothetical protein